MGGGKPMRAYISGLIICLFILGCADNSEQDPRLDCRNLSQICSPGFSCQSDADGVYSCIDQSTFHDQGRARDDQDVPMEALHDATSHVLDMLVIDTELDASDQTRSAVDMLQEDAEVEPEQSCITYPNWRPPENAGVAYITHLESPALRWYTATGEHAEFLGALEMESMVYDSAVDSEHDLLALAHDITRSISLYQLAKPSDDGVAAPILAARIDLAPNAPRKLVIDSARQRLHVVANAPLRPGQLLRNELLFTFDISTPTAPILMSPEPVIIPVVIDIAVDHRNGYLFVVDIVTEELRIFDASGPSVQPLPGTPINLRTLYPERSQTAFDPRDVYVDPVRGRLLIARAQGLLSELMAFRYTPTSSENADCSGRPNYEDLVRIEDPFDLSVAPTDRITIWSTWHAIPVIGTPRMLLVYSEGPSSRAMVTPLEEVDGAIALLEGCGEYEGFGCYYRSYAENRPIGYQLTDGGSCFDQTHKVFVGTSVDRIDEGANGWAFFFRLYTDGTMERVLSEAGSHHGVNAYPVTAECH